MKSLLEEEFAVGVVHDRRNPNCNLDFSLVPKWISGAVVYLENTTKAYDNTYQKNALCVVSIDLVPQKMLPNCTLERAVGVMTGEK